MTTAKPTPLDLAAYEWLKAKEEETAARERRLAAEASIVALAGCKEEGAIKTETEWYEIRTEGSLTRTLLDDFGARLESLPADIQNSLVRWKPSLDVRALKALATANPDAYRIACNAFESKPAKPSVKVTLREAQQVAA